MREPPASRALPDALWGWGSAVLLGACVAPSHPTLPNRAAVAHEPLRTATAASSVADRLESPATVSSKDALPSVAPSAATGSTASPTSATRTPGTPAQETTSCWAPVEHSEANPACQLIRQRNLRVLASFQAFEGQGGSFEAERESTLCFPASAATAWGILFKSASRAKGEGLVPAIRATYSVVFVTNEGRIHRSSDHHYFADEYRRTLVYSLYGDQQGPLQGVVFDYDQDGVPELLLPIGEQNHNGYGDWRGDVWTLKNGRVVRYDKAPRGVVGALDADCDGRPDLLMDEPFRAVLDRGGPYYSSWAGVQEGFTAYLLAHSLPDGGFSSNDSAARDFAASQCPAPSTGFDHQASDDHWADFWTMRCARLWGISTVQLTGDLGRTCRRTDCFFNETPDCCVYKPLLSQWARARPPLTLK